MDTSFSYQNDFKIEFNRVIEPWLLLELDRMCVLVAWLLYETGVEGVVYDAFDPVRVLCFTCVRLGDMNRCLTSCNAVKLTKRPSRMWTVCRTSLTDGGRAEWNTLNRNLKLFVRNKQS